MTLAPGVHVTTSITGRRREAGILPGTLFLTGFTLRGPVGEFREISTLAEFDAVYGDDPNSSTRALVRKALEEQVQRVMMSRIVGPAPVKASLALENSGESTALTVTAVEPGEYWNATTIAVGVDGSDFTLTVVEPDGTTHTSGALADLDEAVAWVGATADTGLANYTITKTGSTDPATLAATPLTGGTDDRGSVTATERAAARDVFTRDLGPGLIMIADAYTTAEAISASTHAAARNRLVLADIADSVSVENSVSHAATIVASANGDRVKINRSWAQCSGGENGQLVTVPWSVLEAGMIGRNLKNGLPVGQAAAGAYGIPGTARGLTREFTDDERAVLNTARVNVAKVVRSDESIRGYGNKAASSTVGRDQFSQAFTRMVIEAEAERAGEPFVHRMLDGERVALGEFLGVLNAIGKRYYAEGSLFGATFEEAFRAVVFEVNTEESMQEDVLRAELHVRTSPSAERVIIQITVHADRIEVA